MSRAPDPGHARHMRHALVLAARGLGNVWPNPAVGCVIVKEGRVIARGRTQPGGRPHAEAVALERAGEAARGATVYVTLEPCAHQGKTPPCAAALVKAGVARVVSALEDPDPRVAGRGHEMLRRAGIAVETGVLAREAAALNRGFLMRLRAGRPMLTLKLATSFDGRIATATGESRWITGEAARREVHLMRARHDAVMVGGATARADDPALTVRGLGIRRQPLRIVVSRALDLPLSGQLAATAREIPLWICHGPGAPAELRSAFEGLGARLIEVPARPGGMPDMGAMMQALGEAGLTRIFCEGGAGLAASLLDADVVDDLVGFTAGLVLGGGGRAAIAPLGFARLAQAPRFRLAEARAIGGDVMHRWERARGQEPPVQVP